MILEELKTQGISVVKNFLTTEELQELLNYQNKLPVYQNPRKKFLVEFWDRRAPLDMNNPFVKFALREDILEIAKKYLGNAHLHDSWLTKTLVMNGNKPMYSQRWHRDPEDTNTLKVFIYLTDVDNESGPLCYVRESQPGGKFDKIFPQNRVGGTYPKLGEVEKVIPKEQILNCSAPAGTVIFANTVGLHKGGYSTGKERLMYTATYLKGANYVGLWSMYKQ